ncbi:hypothetical protein BGZ72_002067, partial [Mortierella alpina]
MRISSAVLLSAAAAVACATQKHKPEGQHNQLYARNRFADRSLADALSGLLPSARKPDIPEVQDVPTSSYVKRDDDLLNGLPLVGDVTGDLLKRNGGLLGGLLGGSRESKQPSPVQAVPSEAYVKRDDDLLNGLPLVGD